MITLTNSFHGTEYRLLGDSATLTFLRNVATIPGWGTRVQLARVKKIQNRLCGTEGCLCGETPLKERK